MCNVKWIKLNTDMFDNEKLKLINATKEKDTIIYIWIRLLIQAGKNNDGGLIYLNKSTPFTNDMLSTIFDRPVSIINRSLEVLEKLKMIKRDKKDFIKIISWNKHQNVEGLEKVREQSRIRMKRMREKKKQLKNSCVTVTQQLSKVTEEKESKNNKDIKNLDLEVEKIKNKESKNNVVIIDEVLKNKKIDTISQTAINIISHYEKLLGHVGVFNYGAIVINLETYGEEWLRHAIDKAIQQGKVSINYVNGILKNWRINGYPKEGVQCGACDIQSNNNEFEKFKPKEARRLTEEEQREAEGKLI